MKDRSVTTTSLVLILCKVTEHDNPSTDVAQVSGYQLLEGFTFSNPEGWPSWIRRFEKFRNAFDLDEKSEEKQVSSLIYAMGDEAEDILDSFWLSDDEQKSYTTVRGKLNLTS